MNTSKATSYNYKTVKEIVSQLLLTDLSTFRYFYIDIKSSEILDLFVLNHFENLEGLLIDPVDSFIDEELEADSNKLDTYFDFENVNEKKSLMNISIYNEEIKNLKIDKFKNLKCLEFDDCKLYRFSGIDNLEKLKSLSFRYCKDITSIAFVKDLKDLKFLNIGGTSVDDYSVLEECEQLDEVVPLDSVLSQSLQFTDDLFGDKRLKIPYDASTIYIIQFFDFYGKISGAIQDRFRTMNEAFLFLRDFLNKREIKGLITDIKWTQLDSVEVNDEFEGRGYWRIKPIENILGY
jgi:hypothetical protein